MEKIMVDSRILVLGDSHTHAIKRALKLRGKKNTNIVAYRYAQDKNGKVIGDLTEKDVINEVSRLKSSDKLISTIGGNQHQAFSLIQHPIPFEIYFSSNDDDVNQSIEQIIPYAQVLDTFKGGLSGRDGHRIKQLTEIAKCKIYHLIPPPPKEDKAHILKRQETAFVKSGILEKGISPASLRLKCWRIQVDALKALMIEQNITLLHPPKTTTTPEGYLKPVFYANDATHANADYGELVLQQLENILNEEG